MNSDKPTPNRTPPDNRGRIIAGAVLVLLGIAFFVMQFVGALGVATILFAVGAVLIAAYFYTRAYGFLVPGCILAGLGLGGLAQVGGLLDLSGLGLVGLGVGFIAIYLIDLAYRGSSRWWPLIPGGILLVLGIVTSSAQLAFLLARGWPLILVAVGLLILAGAFGLRGRRTQ